MKRNRRGIQTLAVLAALILVLFFSVPQTAFAADTTPPAITVWYGSHQVFGSMGLPQKWVNILGNVSDPESGMRDATFSTNGSAAGPLRLGPDERRLEKPGDFNIEIDASSLVEGNNRVEIAADNREGLHAAVTVIVEFHHRAWPIPYQVDWSKVTQAQDALQIVDGKWAWDASGIRPAELGYDRVLAIGDMRWTNYEVTATITVHSIDPFSYQVPGSPGAGFGINLHWLGHTDDPIKCDWPAQPHCGWEPTGASNWYSFKQSGIDTLGIETEPPEVETTITTRKLAFGHTYSFKARVVDGAGGNTYGLKVWEPNAESEPPDWTVQRTAPASYQGETNLANGAFLLVLHRVDATIGNISVVPVP